LNLSLSPCGWRRGLRGNITHKVSLYADSPLLYISNPVESTPYLLDMLQGFGTFSGYKLIKQNKKVSFTFPLEPTKCPVERCLDLNPYLKGTISRLYDIIQNIHPPSFANTKSAWEQDMGVELPDDIWQQSVSTVGFGVKLGSLLYSDV
jgi:hypothetical protein